MAFLEVDGLDAGYETGQVLFDVDLSVEEGEVVSLLGTNGAGKTTTFRCIVGADEVEVYGGSVALDGVELVDKPAYEIADEGISYVPENRRVFPRLSVAENVRLGIGHTDDPMEYDRVMEWFPELAGMQGKNANQLSGGEQQMLAVARSLATNPRLMLLDEPSEGLAPFIVERIAEIVVEINNDLGTTLFLIEQNVNLANAVADRHYILRKGQIVNEITETGAGTDYAELEQYLGVS